MRRLHYTVPAIVILRGINLLRWTRQLSFHIRGIVWKYKERSMLPEDLDFRDIPSGGRIKMWLVGVGVALVPAIYGVYCVIAGHAKLPSENGPALDVRGSAAVALGITYMAVGAFIHVHWFWGLIPRISFVCPVLKVVILVIFLSSLGFAIYRILGSVDEFPAHYQC